MNEQPTRPFHYVLDPDNSVRGATWFEWAKWFEEATRTRRRIVEQTKIGPIFISTVFIGMAAYFHDNGQPYVFETLIQGGKLDGAMWRYTTWTEAAAGHAHALQEVRRTVKLYQAAWWLILCLLRLAVVYTKLGILKIKAGISGGISRFPRLVFGKEPNLNGSPDNSGDKSGRDGEI